MSRPRALLAAIIISALAPAVAGAAPQIFPGGVVNAASFAPAPAPLGPGSIAAIFGTDLAAAVSSATSATLPASLGGTQVLVNGVPAPLFFVSPGQVNFQVPWETGNLSQFTVVVVAGGVSSNSVTVLAASAAPGCFKLQADQGAILIAGTDTLPAPAGSVPGRNTRPARQGEFLSLYCTGLGSVTNPPVTGAPGAVSPLSETLAAPAVTIGTVPARVSFSGLAPGLTGCNQINVEVPGGAPSGDAVPIVVITSGGMSNTVTAAIEGTAGPAVGTLAIASLSTASPLPMTPLAIRALGLAGSESVQVRYSNAAGFSAAVRPLRVGADGTVIAPVPIYIDPSAGQITAGTVSVVVSQGARSTAPVTLAIRNLPPLSEYGTALGKISEAVLVFDSIMIGQRLNQFEAYQRLPGSLDTSQARTTLRTLLRAINRARIDVSRIAGNPSLVIPGGTLADGTALQFDRESLELMDRVNGLFLSQTFAITPPSPVVRGRASAAAAISVADLIGIMESTTDASSLLQASLEAMNPQNTWAEMTEASATALEVYFSALPAARAKLLGPAAAILSDMCAIGHAFGNMGALITGLATRNGELTKVAYDALNESTADTISAGIDMVLLLTGNVAQLGAASTVAGFVKSFYDLHVTNQATLDGITAAVANDLKGRLPAGTFGVANGSTPLPVESQLTSPQAGIEICCFTASGSTLTSITDPSGNYTLWIPLQAAGTDYQRLLVRALSLLSGVETASGTRDLRGLRPDAPLTLSPLTSTAGMSDVYEGTYSLTVTASEVCLSPAPVLVPVKISASGAKITLVASAALETVPPGGSAAFTGWLLAQGVPSYTFSCDTGLQQIDPTPFACAANGAFAGTGNGRSVALTMQTAAAGCPDHIIPGSVSVAASKPVVNLSASYTQLTLFGHPAQVVFSATLTKK